VHFFLCDICKRRDIEDLVEACIGTFGTPDIIVNNARGLDHDWDMLDVDEATFDRIYALHLKPIYFMAHAVVPLMRQRKRGVILNLGRAAGSAPRHGWTWDSTCKGAVTLLSKLMAVELGPYNIRVNAICPVMEVAASCAVLTDELVTAGDRSDMLTPLPLGRMCQPSDVAAAAAFLASDAAASISGVELPVGGGRTF
jgi:3-oxoacyl-[acyl-carrier protein] reductase